MDSENVTSLQFQPLNWLKDAKIYNKKGNLVAPDWLEQNADIIVLLFTSKGADKDGIVHKFYTIYETSKLKNVAIEVINVPFDETEKEYLESYEDQANWFTLRYDDPLVFILQYMYGITCVPFMVVIKPDCTVISSHGLSDIEAYGKNAVITWITSRADSGNQRKVSADAEMYGADWKYASTGDKKPAQRRFSGSSRLTAVSDK